MERILDELSLEKNGIGQVQVQLKGGGGEQSWEERMKLLGSGEEQLGGREDLVGRKEGIGALGEAPKSEGMNELERVLKKMKKKKKKLSKKKRGSSSSSESSSESSGESTSDSD